MRQTLDCPASFKSDNAGTFTGYLSIHGNTDAQNERVIAGAFADDLRENGSRRPALWNHSPSEPVGWMDLVEDARGLRVTRGQLLLDVQRGRETHALMKAGIVTGLSIGFETIGSRIARDGARELTKLRLWEGSLCVFPANDLARVDAVKAAELGELAELLRRMRAMRTEHELAELLRGIRATKGTLR